MSLNEGITWCFALLISVLAVIIAIHSYNVKRIEAIDSAIEHGSSPMEAACAYDNVGGYKADSICFILIVKDIR